MRFHPPALHLSFPLSGVLYTLTPCCFPARAHHLLMVPSAPHQQQHLHPLLKSPPWCPYYHLWVLGGLKDSETVSRDTMSTVSVKRHRQEQGVQSTWGSPGFGWVTWSSRLNRVSSELSLHVADTTQRSQGHQRWEEEALQGTPVLCPPGL